MSLNVNNEYEEVLNLIKQRISNSEDIINHSTKNNASGIYMIYIDNFSDDKILPIYIGKSNNLQKRYESHYKEILSLNHLSYDTYYEYFYHNGHNFYDGHFRVCKIFKYMLDHNCDLKDYKMIVLEYGDNDKLEELEQKYIKLFKSEFFGFNQLNIVSLYPLVHHSINNNDKNNIIYYLNKAIENCYEIKKYIDYGFTKFNYNYSVYGLKQFSSDVVCERVNILENNFNTLLSELRNTVSFECYKDIENLELQKTKLKEERIIVTEPIDDAYKKVEDAKKDLKNKVKILLKDYKVYSAKFNCFISGIFNDEDKKSFNNYLKKKNIHIRPYYRLVDDINQIYDLQQNILNVKKSLEDKLYQISDKISKINDNIYTYKKQIMSLIFPINEFNAFALKDNVHPIVYPKVKEKYLIYILLSNNSRCKDADIVKVECVTDERVDTYFIKNRLNEGIQAGCKYKEKNYHIDTLMFGKTPFNIVPEKYCCDLPYYMCINPGFISTSVELKYGINDYTIKNKKLYDLEDVIKNLKLKIGKEKYVIKCSESKNALNTALFDFKKNKIINKFFEL